MKQRRGGAMRWAWAALVVASIATWWPTWDEPFAEDDFLFLEIAAAVGPAGLVRYFGSEGVMDHHYRPLSDPLWYGFATTPARYHFGLQLFHAAAAVLVLSLGRALGFGLPAAFLGALFWATRDFAFPSMIWASGFSDIGSTAFALASLWAYAAFRRSGSFTARAGSLAFFLAAILTKETAIVTLPLLFVVEWLGGFDAGGLPAGTADRGLDNAGPSEQRQSLRRSAARLLPYVMLGIPVAALQLGLARFDDAYGQSLYQLSAGMHTVWLWPVYAAWSFAAIPAFAESPVARLTLVLAAGAGVALAIVSPARRPRASADAPSADAAAADAAAADAAAAGRDKRLAWLALAWFTAAILPALFALGRINTNYAMLASVGPCLWLAHLLAAWIASRGARRIVAVCLLGLIVAIGPALVLAKDNGRIASGGWVTPAWARAASSLVEAVTRAIPAPDPPRDLVLVLFGAVDLNPALLADLGEGFGPQSGLQSAFRRAYGRRNIRVAALPPLHGTQFQHFDVLQRMLQDGADEVHVLDVRPAPVDLTAAAMAAAHSSTSVDEFRRALLAATVQ